MQNLNLKHWQKKYIFLLAISVYFPRDGDEPESFYPCVPRMGKGQELLRTTSIKKVAMVGEQVSLPIIRISAGASGNITEAAGILSERNNEDEEATKKYNDMKYQYKLTNLLVLVSWCR